MPRKPEVSITLSCCPRCGWPNADEESDAAVPRKKEAATPQSTRTSAQRSISKSEIDPFVGRAWKASDFGLSQADFRKHFTPTLVRDGLRYVHCELEGHAHASEEEESACMLEWIEKARTRLPQPEEIPSVDDCTMLRHTHGPEGKLFCVMLRASMLREQSAWAKAQPWNHEPPVQGPGSEKRARGRPRKHP